MFAVLAFLVVTVHAQQAAFSKDDFDALRSKGDPFLTKVTYRVKITSERYSETDSKNPSSLTTQTAEFQPPDRRRAIFSFKTSAKVELVEIVEIGKKRFKRSDNSSWIEENIDSQNRYTIKGDIVDHKEVYSFKRMGNVRIAGIKAVGYESNRTSEFQSPNRKLEYVERIWVDKQGRFLKREEWTSQNGKLVSHVLWEYDYDSKVEIEAPIK